MASSAGGRALLKSAHSGRLWEMCIGLEVHAQVLSNSKLMSGAGASKSASARPNRQVSFLDAALPGTLPRVNRECVHQAIRTGLALRSQVHERSLFERKHYFYPDLPQGYQITQQRAPIASQGELAFEVPMSALRIVDTSGQDSQSMSAVPEVFDASKYKNRREKNEALRQWKAAREQQQQQRAAGEDMTQRIVRVARIQIEQDSGKSVHEMEDDSTLVDLNRAGSALLEIVMEPDLRSAQEAGQVLKHLQHLLRHLGVCDGNMEEGSMRCDLNVSVRCVGDQDESTSEEAPFGERVEVKNMNSIRNLIRAAEFEARRQIELIEVHGGQVTKETRSFDAATGETKRMRTKEGAKDYRFFPEPDLPPLVVDQAAIERIEQTMPELPQALRDRLNEMYGISTYESSVLVNEPGAAAYFEAIVAESNRSPKLVVSWMLNELFGHLKTLNADVVSSPVSAVALGELVDLVEDGTISGKMAKELLEVLCFENTERKLTPLEIVEERNWKQIQDEDAIVALCQDVLSDPKTRKNVAAYRSGKKQLFGFFIGQVMKACGGRAHPERTNEIMKRLLDDE